VARRDDTQVEVPWAAEARLTAKRPANTRYHRRGIISVASSEVFLSYASADRERVATLVHTLEAEGIQVWWDRDIAYGESFHKVIEQALSAAACVIVVWTSNSVASEWVVNEASDARKRNRLVPVLIEPVKPPLEFRHLQTADLSNWEGDAADPQFAGLRQAVSAMLGRADPSQPMASRPVRARTTEWIRPMQWLGIGGLALGVSVLLLTLKYVGLIGATSPPEDRSGTPSTQSPSGTDSGRASPSRVTPPPLAPGATHAEPTNLFDTDGGARLIAANEAGWRRLFTGNSTFSVVGRTAFVVIALPGNTPARFDTLAVFVDSTSTDNVRELAILISSASAEGPWLKAAQVSVPNYRNMDKPLHELRFTPVEARFVKLQVVSLQNDYGPNGILGSIQLYSSSK